MRQDFGRVVVDGEISNYKQHSSGHCYFSLGDSDAQLKCVMWRSTRQRLRFDPQDGLAVTVRGEVTIYATRGDLQLVVQAMKPAGEGDFQKAFLKLKNKLEKEGLFDREMKKRLPRFPESIGIITSGSGAALHDILSILERRYPLVEVLVLPVRVQGVGAAREIVEAIELFNNEKGALRPDVLIVGRGGGSIEDLWAFNEEPVARAMFASAIPIISAVGHETDYSIADFVADIRAATPSMAAELAVPDGNEILNGLAYQQENMSDLIHNRLASLRERVLNLSRAHALRRLRQRIERDNLRVENLRSSLTSLISNRQTILRQRTEALARLIASLDPKNPLKRGYIRVYRDGKAVSEGRHLSKGDSVSLRFVDVSREATIDE